VRVFLAAVLLLLTVLAGCAGKANEPTDASAQPSHDDLALAAKPVVLTLNVTIGNATYRFSGADLASSRPAASSSSSTVTLSSSKSNSTTASANTTGAAAGNATGNASATPSGPAPLNVTFELGAKQLTNKSGLRWSLGARQVPAAPAAAANATGTPSAGNGTATGVALPATVKRIYNTTGSYQVTYTLTRANKTLDKLDVTLIVSNGTASVQAPVEIPFTVDGSITFGTQGANGCGASNTIDVAEHEWDLTAVSSITKVVVHMDLGDSNLDSDIVMLDPAGAEVGSSQDFNQPVIGSGSPTEDFEVEGPLAPGIYTFLVRGCVGVAADYTITATASALV
jgi:hypothetical protein